MFSIALPIKGLHAMRRLLPFLLLVFLTVSCDSGPGPNEVPSVSISFTPSSPRAGEAVTFEAEATDTDGEVESYDWSTSDGASGSGRTFTHAFDVRGNYSVSVTVEDDRGGTANGGQQLTIDRRFSKATISNVEVQDMPFTDDDGNQWDPNSGPDVFYVAVNNETENSLAASQGIFNVQPSDLPVEYDETEFTIEELTQEHSINLIDQDDNSSTFIGGVSFTLDTDPGVYPEEATIEFDDIRYEVDLEWSN